MVKVVSWNCRGTNRQSLRNCRELVKLHSPDIIFLLETKCSSKVVANNFMLRLGLTSFDMVDSNGLAGGIILLWNHHRVNLVVQHRDVQFIHTSGCAVYSYGDC